MTNTDFSIKQRIGHGYDVHAFCAGNVIVLGGCEIKHTHGLRAHSDGDVLLHALCDAMLGAAGMGDIGEHFPDTDPEYANADSRMLLRRVKHLLEQHQWMVNNVDATVLAETPKLSPYKAVMAENIARDLELSSDCVNVKATTTEQLGFVGRKQGIAAHVVCLLVAKP